MIDVQNISYKIGPKTILKDIKLHIPLGKFTAILGPNGAGKSSLLKCLTGSLMPCVGSILFDGCDLSHYSLQELSRKRAILSQNIQISFPYTVREIVSMGRNPHVMNRETTRDEDIVEEILMQLDAASFMDRIYSTLSGGEQQRVQFARVLAQIWDQDGACLFLDEPTSALDLKYQLNILDLAQKLSEEKNFTIVAILHDLNLAKIYADHIFLLKDGCLFDHLTDKQDISLELVSQLYDIPMSHVARLY